MIRPIKFAEHTKVLNELYSGGVSNITKLETQYTGEGAEMDLGCDDR